MPMGDRKIYDAKLHKDVEIAETIKIKEIFSKTDIEIVQHPFGDYDIDIGLKLVNQPVGLIEVENRKDSWQRGDFPHLSISLLERKFKYAKRYDKYCLFYLGFRSDMEDCYVFSSWVLKEFGTKHKIEHRPNSIGSDLKNEYRYSIPVGHAVWGIDNCVSYIRGSLESYLKIKGQMDGR
jgi:hypothetical protein